MKGYSDTEEHRRQCEARQILAWPFEKRRPYLDLVGKRRGAAAREELEMEVRRQYRLGKRAA
ncbi:DUF7696 family protein [Achromobacter xylosoxidans]|uniref:DUF7696 family protein n=1 Tax=Alcaligenes xylosoxydans xylosoxydans TaxID=85698 RepID=UPI003B99FBA5